MLSRSTTFAQESPTTRVDHEVKSRSGSGTWLTLRIASGQAGTTAVGVSREPCVAARALHDSTGEPTMRSDISRDLTRRELLTAGLAAAGALALHTRVNAAPSAAEGPYGPFKMGLQSYSLRGYMVKGKPDVEKALAITKDLGLHYWEAYPAHIPTVASADEIARYKKMTGAHERRGHRLRRHPIHEGPRGQPQVLRIRQGHGARLPVGGSRPPTVSTASTSWSRSTASGSASTTTVRDIATP